MVVAERHTSSSHTSPCMCGGVMVSQVDTLIEVVNGREIRIHNVPFYECTLCKEREYDLDTRVATIAVEAFRRGLTDVVWSEKLFLNE